MQTIWKYSIPFPKDRFTIKLKDRARVLHVDLQDGRPQLWASVNTDFNESERHFHIVGTGHPVPEDVVAYVGTWQDGSFVWHLFEVAQP